MIDFGYSSPSLGVSLYCTILYLFIICIGYKHSINNNNLYKYRNIFTFLILLFVVTCSVVGDFYHYQQMVWNYDFTLGAKNHGEPIYRYIIGFVEKNYLLFRILVWGSGIIIYNQLVKRIGFNQCNVLFVLFSLYALVYSYARASLAMVLYFGGLTVFVVNNKNILFEKILGLFLIFFSYCFHHSIFILIVLTPIIYIRFTKRYLIFLVIVLPLLFIITKGYIQQIMFDESTLGNDELQGKLQLYSNREVAMVNWKGVIYEFSGYLTFFIPISVCTYLLYFKNKVKIPNIIHAFFNLSLTLVLISIMFLCLDIQGKVFFYRILYMTFIPLSIILYYIYNAKLIQKKSFIHIIIIGIMAQLYRLLYSIYLYV